MFGLCPLIDLFELTSLKVVMGRNSVFCTLSSVQSVNMYCPYVNCCLHSLEHARKNFTHQGTCAVVM